MLDFLKNLLSRRMRDNAASALVVRRFDMAQKLGEWGDHAAAIEILKDCISQKPKMAPLHFYLGENYAAQGNFDKAAESYARYLAVEPGDSLGATIKLAFLGLADVPDALPSDYVRAHYDRIAPSFDTALAGHLGDDGPSCLASAVFSVSTGAFGRIADLGCGTGLSGAPFKGHALWMDGVDLSGGMVDEARKKNIYDALHIGDMTDFLEKAEVKYDLILCSDVLICHGVAERVFPVIHEGLKKGGLFAFSIQKTKDAPFVLGRDHRFAHGEEYITESLLHAGFDIIFSEEKMLRREHGNPAAGMIFVTAKM